MQVTLVGTKVTVVDTKVIGFQLDNLVTSFTALVDTTSDWSYKLDISYGKDDCSGEQLYNIIDLGRVGNACSVDFTREMLPFNGKWTAQLRGISGNKVYHSETFEIWCKFAINPSESYEPIPSEFYQIEGNITELNSHPPYPNSQSGYWMLWNVVTHQYEQSTIPAHNALPEITPQTAGKYLTNDGVNAQWSAMGGDKTFVFTQAVAASTWNITHNMSKYPSVTIVDSGDNVVVGEMHYESNNALTITFTSAFSGKAYLN